MFLEVFDVEHGACALITTSNGKRVMIDCGHNAATNWRPGSSNAQAALLLVEILGVIVHPELLRRVQHYLRRGH
jgi:hypothetical protein